MRVRSWIAWGVVLGVILTVSEFVGVYGGPWTKFLIGVGLVVVGAFVLISIEP